MVKAPMMPPTARVTSATPPIACSMRPSRLVVSMAKPCESSQANTFIDCVSIVAGSAAACAVIWLPANQPIQPMKAAVSSNTIATSQPRPIGRTRPSRRAPPSIRAANTMPPKIISSDWASNTASAISAVMPSQTKARLASCRRTGSEMSVGPACLLETRGFRRLSKGSAISARRFVDPRAQTAPSALAAQGSPPGQRIQLSPPSNENVTNSARPPISESGTGPRDRYPRAAPARRRNGRGCRPSGKRGPGAR